MQYIARDQPRSSAEVFTHVSHPKGVMAWVAISAKGIFKPIFVEPGAKIDAIYYIKKVLVPFLKDVKNKYHNMDFWFHHDSEPAHTSKITLEFLNQNKIKFITPKEWMPCSPDAAPCDYFLWGYVKSQLKKYKIYTIDGLKRAIRKELKLVPQCYVDRALNSWGKRCRQIYDAKGLHIEKHR